MAAGIFVALVKPWGTPPPVIEPAAVAPGPPSAAAGASPAPAAGSPSPGLSWQCSYSSGWRVFAARPPTELSRLEASPAPASHEGSASSPTPSVDPLRPARMWLAIEPAGRADDPLGPWVPTVRIVLEESPALGYCAPTSGPDRPPAQVVVSAWSIGSPGDARPLALRKIPVPDDGGSTEGLFAPVGLAQGATAGWPPGRYVFRVGDPSGGYQRWFGVEVRQWAAGMDDGRTSPPETSPAP